MGQRTAPSTGRELFAEVACPRCDRPVDAPVPDHEVEPTVSPYVAAFGEHAVVRCPAGHEFWVYYC